MTKKEITLRLAEVIHDLGQGKHKPKSRELKALRKLRVLFTDIIDDEVDFLSYEGAAKNLNIKINDFLEAVKESVKWK